MGKNDFSLLTVSQLKEKLKSKGLPVSGNKAELVSRLNATPKPIESTVSKPEHISIESSNQEDTPFFQALFAGGIGAVEIDRWKAVKYGMSLIMIFLITTSLNSNTWYTVSISETYDSEPYMGYTEKLDVDYGLTGLKLTNSFSFYGSETETFDYDSATCQYEALQCEQMSNAGNIMQIFLWISLLTISTLLIISIMRGFGKLKTGFIDENYSKIDFWGFSVSSLLLILGTIVYASISFTYDTSELSNLEGGSMTNGLGSTWWMMFILSSIFMAIVFNPKGIERLFEFVKSKFD